MSSLRGPESRYLRIWVAIVLLLLVVIAGLAYSNVRTNHALDQSRQATVEVTSAVACINNLLGARGPLTNADTNAEVDIFSRLIGVLLADSKDQARLYKLFLTESRKDLDVLMHDKTFRAQHPLGLC